MIAAPEGQPGLSGRMLRWRMSTETASPFIRMLAACVVAAHSGDAEQPSVALVSARRWWDMTPPAERHGVLLRACRLAALALQLAVDVEHHLWPAEAAARSRVDELIQRFEQAVIEPYGYHHDLAAADIAGLRRELFLLGQLLVSKGYLEGRISLADVEEEFPATGDWAVDNRTLRAAGGDLADALVQPIQAQDYYAQAIGLVTEDCLLDAAIGYALCRLMPIIEADAGSSLRWPAAMSAYCVGIEMLFASEWDFILSLEQSLADQTTRVVSSPQIIASLLLGSQSSPNGLQDLIVRTIFGHSDLADFLKNALRSGSTRDLPDDPVTDRPPPQVDDPLHQVLDVYTYRDFSTDRAADFFRQLSSQPQNKRALDHLEIFDSIRLFLLPISTSWSRSTSVVIINKKDAPANKNNDLLSAAGDNQTLYAARDLPPNRVRGPLLLFTADDHTLYPAPDTPPNPTSSPPVDANFVLQTLHVPSPAHLDNTDSDFFGVSYLTQGTAPAPDGHTARTATQGNGASSSPVSTPICHAQGNYSTKKSKKARKKERDSLRDEVRQLLRRLEDLVEALKTLRNGWRPAKVTEHLTSGRSGVKWVSLSLIAFNYYVEHRKIVKRLFKRLASIHDKYKRLLDKAEHKHHDDQSEVMIRIRDDLRRELNPNALNRQLSRDSVAVFAVVGDFTHAAYFGKEWLRGEEQLRTAHNLGLACLDWGKHLIENNQRDNAVKKWWDAVEYWARVLVWDGPYVTQHWRQIGSVYSKMIHIADDGIVQGLTDVREQVFSLLGAFPWEVLPFDEEPEARWLYKTILALFNVPAGDHKRLASIDLEKSPRQHETKTARFEDAQCLIDDLLSIAVHPDTGPDLLEEWEERERARQQYGAPLLLHAEHPLRHLQRRHFSRPTFDLSNPHTAHLCRKLRGSLHECFDMSDLKILCHNLGIEFEDLHTDTKRRACWSLVSHCKLHSKVDRLADEVIKTRPDVSDIKDLLAQSVAARP